MTDYHVHIGQFNTAYYKPEYVLDALRLHGVDDVWFSDISSCISCQEMKNAQHLFDRTGNTNILSVSELVAQVRTEVSATKKHAADNGMSAHALYWVVPDIEKAGIIFEDCMDEIPYEGFKLHPRGQLWNWDDPVHISLAERVFSYAEIHQLPILIHTGYDGIDHAKKFEPFIASHPTVSIQLAHCRPLDETLFMLRTYKNISVDTAFVDLDTIKQIKIAGFDNRIRYGSDFPINHFFYCDKSNLDTQELFYPKLDEISKYAWNREIYESL